MYYFYLRSNELAFLFAVIVVDFATLRTILVFLLAFVEKTLLDERAIEGIILTSRCIARKILVNYFRII